MEHSPFKPNSRRVHQRQFDVVKAALRARSFTEAELTAEAASLIKFCFNLIQKNPEDSFPKGDEKDE